MSPTSYHCSIPRCIRLTLGEQAGELLYGDCQQGLIAHIATLGLSHQDLEGSLFIGGFQDHQVTVVSQEGIANHNRSAQGLGPLHRLLVASTEAPQVLPPSFCPLFLWFVLSKVQVKPSTISTA